VTTGLIRGAGDLAPLKGRPGQTSC
jgi:hypothetical protein